jgi:ABC-2 type transport system ATP-binding protein
LQFADTSGLEAAARTLGEVSRDDDALTLQVPNDGNVRSIKALLDRLDDQSIDVNDLSIHTPDLDDVFFALTGHPDTQKGNVR